MKIIVHVLKIRLNLDYIYAFNIKQSNDLMHGSIK